MSADVLSHIYNSCDPYKPAAEDYFDCTPARGSNALVPRFMKHLALSKGRLHFLFSGHVGCGKSSELRQLKIALDNASSSQGRYFPVLVDVDDYVDVLNVTSTDILLAIVSELAATLREKLSIEIKDNYFKKRLNELKNYFLSDVEINDGEIALWAFKLKIQRLKKDPSAREKVRKELEPEKSTLLNEINLVFDKARVAVKNFKVQEGEAPYKDFVLILDSLERIQGYSGKPDGIESQRQLFIEYAPQLRGLDTHIIYTVPLELARADGPKLKQRYGVDPFVLPMIKVFERGTNTPYEMGWQCLHHLLQKHLGDVLLTDAFTPEAIDFLLQYCGGHTRSLMTFVQEACAYTDKLPIPLSAAHKAIQQTVRSYSTAIPDHHWQKLAELDKSVDQQIPGGDDDYLLMLEQLTVLEYINGGDENPFELAEPWYAVNPIVRQLQKFKSTRLKESAKIKEPAK